MMNARAPIKVLAIVSAILVTSSCGPSQDELIATALAETQAAATPTLTPELSYVQEITPVLETLDKLTATSSEFSILIQKNTSWLQICEGVARSVGPFKCDLQGDNDRAIALSEQLLNEAFDAKSALEAVTPLPALRTSHTQISDCIEVEIDRARFVNNLVVNGTVSEIRADLNACDLYPNALEKIKSFVAENQ